MNIFLMTGISISLGLFSLIVVHVQNMEKRVQIKIIENGKIKTDTSFTINDNDVKDDVKTIRNRIDKDTELIIIKKNHKK
jgi:hypothetical protein